MDYKSSSKEIDLNLAMQGFNIQMLVYLDMLCKQENKDRAGMLYFNMKKRILTRDTSYALGDEDVLKEYRMEGYIVDDGSTNSVKGLGSTPELIAPVKIQDLENMQIAKVISPDELDQIMEYVQVILEKTVLKRFMMD